MRLLGSVLQIIGLAGTCVGGWLLVPWCGVLLAGAAVFAVGYQLERLHTPGGG